MKQVNLLPADTYIVINNSILTNDDRLRLTMLYQPIIGGMAINLYFTLWSFLDVRELISSEWTHHHLMSSTRVDLESLKGAREKLEAIGLLKTYIKKDNVNNYVYELYSPVSSYDFFSNPILNTVLYNNVGKLEYERIVTYFKTPKISLDDYNNITSAFTDVFTPVTELPIETLASDIKRHNYRSLELVSKIDVNNILSKIPEELLNPRSITNDIKEFIYKLSFIYSLDDFNAEELIKNSVNEQRKINKELLQQNCQNYFRFENEGKLPSLAYKNQPEYLRKQNNGTSNRDKMIYTFETTSPSEFLMGRNNTSTITKNDKDILSYLLIELNLKPGVVNVLIDYVLKINNNKLIKSFIEVIASQWKRSNIETVEDAMLLAEKEYKNRSKSKIIPKGSNKKVETVPEWFNKEIEVKVPSSTSRKEIEEILRGNK
ncbi:MAG: DnaD domain protein [Bacilli bacterium]|nr:DnaD domain protein [Bacilli bacterium]MDD4282857.1 DnaD domain protein [Bacilli bacterium]MDD4718676.1 DnaD domain protein [Bacilli bacterium]